MVRYLMLIIPLVLGGVISCSDSKEFYPMSGTDFNLPWFYLEIPENGFEATTTDTVYYKSFDFPTLFEKYLDEPAEEFNVFYSFGNSTQRKIILELIYQDLLNNQVFREIFEISPNSPEFRNQKQYLRTKLDRVAKMAVLVLSERDRTVSVSAEGKFYMRSDVPYQVVSQ